MWLQVIDLHMQLRNYKKVEKWLRKKLGESKARKRMKKAVYLFSIGTNDYMSLFLTNSTFLTAYTPSQYVDMVIANITSVIIVSFNYITSFLLLVTLN